MAELFIHWSRLLLFFNNYCISQTTAVTSGQSRYSKRKLPTEPTKTHKNNNNNNNNNKTGWVENAHEASNNRQGRNEVYGIMDQKGVIWDHSPGIINHKPWGRDQQSLEGSGFSLYNFCGIKICHAFGIKNQKFGYRNGISIEKHTSLRLFRRQLLGRQTPRKLSDGLLSDSIQTL